MTCYLTGRDDRFAAAVAGGVVSDLVSMTGTSDAGHYLGELELGGPSWESRDRYDEMSPLATVDAVHTPTLIYQGAATSAAPSARPSSGTARCRARASRRGLCSTGRSPPLRAERPPVAPRRLQPSPAYCSTQSTMRRLKSARCDGRPFSTNRCEASG